MESLLLLADVIFFWIKIFVPVLFILRIFKIKLSYIKTDALIASLSISMLIAAMLYLLAVLLLLIQYAIARYFGAEYQQYAFINRAFGPYWYSWWLPVIINITIPQIMWVKRYRISIKTTYILFCCLLAFTFLQCAPIIITSLNVNYTPSSWAFFIPSFTYSLGSLIIFLILITAIYFTLLKTQNSKLTTRN